MPLMDKVVITMTGLLTLWPGQRLNDEIIYAWLQCLQLHSKDRMLAIDTFFMYYLKQGRMGMVLNKFRDTNPFDFEVVLVPLNLSEGVGHWVLISIHIRNKTIECFDPMGSTSTTYSDELNLLVDVLDHTAQRWGQATSPWTLDSYTPRLQGLDDTTNCGVYVCACAQYIVRGSIVTIRNTDEYRKMMFQVYYSTF